MDEIYLGADCAVKHHHLSLQVEGVELKSFRISNHESHLRECLTSLGAEAEVVHLVVEGLYGFSSTLVAVARDLGFVIWQVNPKALAHYRDVEGTVNKTDAIDAYLAARMAFQGLKGCRLALETKPPEMELRQLTRLHRQVTGQKSEADLRLRSKLLERVPEIYQDTWDGPSPDSRQFFKILKRWPGFVGLAGARLKTIENVLKGGPIPKERREAQAQALKRMVRSLGDVPEVWAFELEMLVSQLDLLIGQLKAIDERNDRAVKAHPIARKLTEMFGVGSFVAGVWVGELLPLARTSSEAKVATYAGLTPVARRSGTGGREIFRSGSNKQALHASYMSAIASLQWSPLDNAYYQKQKKRHSGHPKPHVAATLALARQRNKVMYKLMTTEARYDQTVLLRSHLQRREEQAA